MKPPQFMYPDPRQRPEERPFDVVKVTLRTARTDYRVPTNLIDETEVPRRHLEEVPEKCALSRVRSRDVTGWNVAGRNDPITLVEANWFDTEWHRAYFDFENGYHRVERALEDRIPEVWIQVHEYRFAPRGQRPPDRTGLGL